MSNTPPEEQAKPKRQYSRKNHRREKNSKNAPVETSQQEVLKTEDDSFKKGNSGELTQKELPSAAPARAEMPETGNTSKPQKGKSPLLKEAFFKKNYLKDNPLNDAFMENSPADERIHAIPAQSNPAPGDGPSVEILKEKSVEEAYQGKENFRRDNRHSKHLKKDNRRPERVPHPEQKTSEHKPAEPVGDEAPSRQPIPKQQNQPTQQPKPKAQEKKRTQFIPGEPPPSQTETDPFLKSFYKKLENSLKELGVEKGSSIICAVSGGVDSVAMFHAMMALAPSHGFRISVAHCNHNLRGKDSARDEQFVRHITKKHGLYYNHTQVNVKAFAAKNSFSIEKAARVMRYKFFEKVAKESKFNYLATAHTADDAAETFFLNLLRGSGLTGLAGIPARRPLTNKTNVIRPVLHFTKAELIEYARKRNLEWHEDVTNSLALYTRNKVRHELMPILKEKFSPAIDEIIIRTMHLLQGADKVVADRVNELLQHVAENVNGHTLLKTTLFAGVDEFLQGEIIQRIITEKFDSTPATYETVDRVISLITSETGAICEISKHVYALRDRDGILFLKKTPVFNLNETIEKTGNYTFGDHKILLKEIPNRDLDFGADPNIEYFDAELLPQRLTLRTWQPGDSFQPIGMRGTMKVSDFLTNEKVPLTEKQNVLVLSTSSDIIWICGHRISDKFKVTEKTDKVISVEFIPPKN
ncbi:MAG TPA: tRNA lysidine(34) synthetase TilS [Patescibacteria group bacterium]|nr:tRNA lysidine(34) synthetase TilS [Patescibacteria group bacterium]